MTTLPDVVLIQRDTWIGTGGEPYSRDQFEVRGGDVTPEWAAKIRPPAAAWCSVAIYNDGDKVAGFGGEVWPAAWPALFEILGIPGVTARQLTRLTLGGAALFAAARSRGPANQPAPTVAPVLEESSPRDVKIAVARQAIESCLLEDDQLADGYGTPFVESAVVVFTVACPDWERGDALGVEARKALADVDLASFSRRTLERGETRVEIRVVVGAVDRKLAGAPGGLW